MKYGRKLLETVEGYVPGEQPRGGAFIKLNTNENPYPPSPYVLEALQTLTTEACRRYPDPMSVRLRTLAAERYGLPGPEWVVAGNGMDEILALTVRTFVDPEDTIISPYPTYTLYETLAKLHGSRFSFVSAGPDYALPEGLAACEARLLFLPRPNAPTGIAYPKEQVEALCAAFKGIVYIDEAYVDFADDNCADLVLKYDNVIVGRTFSKSFSLAGMRLGLALANPAMITEFMKTKDSYNINSATQAVGCAALEDYAYMEAVTTRVKASRESLRESLIAMGFSVTPSQSNFLLARWAGTPSAHDLYLALKERKILVRYFDADGLRDAVRISIGNAGQNEELLTALGELIGAAV